MKIRQVTPALVYDMSDLKQSLLLPPRPESTIIKHSKRESRRSQVQHNTVRIRPGFFPLCMSQANRPPTKTCFASAAVQYFDMLV